ncbi:hypothetical protein KEH51_06605 [[Brevibacterium] frigoritolerans]|uniref:Uncharacterized protein n=1 Tax=Peribacillus frigoritolerans TaxID=450367 RepID=A0A941FQP0_9BACI|nr:hypothetical protein [Peribacillus frigoritolerans]
MPDVSLIVQLVMFLYSHKTVRKIIHVNLDNKEIGKVVPTILGIVSDVKTFMVKLAEAHKALGAQVAATAEVGTRVNLTEERKKWARKRITQHFQSDKNVHCENFVNS